MAPKTARRIDPDHSEKDVPLSHVHLGDTLGVRPGEKVPVDGAVLDIAAAAITLSSLSVISNALRLRQA